jgi:hypothetical protein
LLSFKQQVNHFSKRAAFWQSSKDLRKIKINASAQKTSQLVQARSRKHQAGFARKLKIH